MEHMVTVRWAGNRQFIGWDEGGHGVVMDVKPEKGGDDTGTSPLQLVLFGLAGCTAFDIVGILQKKRQPIEGLLVTVKGRQTEAGPPRPYEHMDVEYIVSGEVDPKAVDDAIRLSEETYCSVRAMLVPTVSMSSTWRYATEADRA